MSRKRRMFGKDVTMGIIDTRRRRKLRKDRSNEFSARWRLAMNRTIGLSGSQTYIYHQANLFILTPCPKLETCTLQIV